MANIKKIMAYDLLDTSNGETGMTAPEEIIIGLYDTMQEAITKTKHERHNFREIELTEEDWEKENTMKVNFYENNGDMLLMVVRNAQDEIVFAHDYDGDYDRAEEDAAIAGDAQPDDLAAWDGNILEDEDEMARYGIESYESPADAFEEMIAENEGRNTSNGICERKDMQLYRVKPEFTDRWFGDRSPTAITAREIWRLAEEWDEEVSDLMEQVTEAE